MKKLLIILNFFIIAGFTNKRAGAEESDLYISYKELKSMVQQLKIKDPREYFDWAKEINLSDIPRGSLAKIYGEQWEGWPEFLNTQPLEQNNIKFDQRSFIKKPKKIKPAKSVHKKSPSRKNLLSLEKMPQAIQTYNQNAPQNEQITTKRTYHLFHHNIPNAPSYNTLSNWFKNIHQNEQGLNHFLFPEKPPFLSLEEMPQAIQTYNQNARSKKILSLEEMPQAIQQYNQTAPENEQITSSSTYRLLRFKIPGAPSYETLSNWFKKTHQNAKGLSQFLFPEKPPSRKNLLSLEKMPQAIQQYNKTAPENKQITTKRTYHLFHHNIPNAPSYNTLSNWFKNIHQNEQGLNHFLFPEKPPRRRKNLLSLEEMPQAIQTYNQTASLDQKITSEPTYKKFYKNIPHAPSLTPIRRWYQNKFGTHQGLNHFLFPKSPLLSLEKMPQAIQTYNQNAPKNQRITSANTYKQFYKNIPKAPSYAALSKWFKKIHQNEKGLSQFLFSGKSPCIGAF